MMTKKTTWGGRACGVVCGLLLGALLTGCNLDLRSQEEKQRAAQQALADAQMQRELQERSDLMAHPDRFLEASDFKYYDKGIINDYRQLTGLHVLNRSKHAVMNLAGEIDWLDNSDRKYGSIPFTLRGSVGAGATVYFSEQDGTLASGTIQGKATRARIRFTSLQIVDPR